jgi:BioD-like phosphotransacetylase family protein
MATLYIASSDSYAGKTLTCLALGKRWQRQNRKVGYIKPLGVLPEMLGDQLTDADAHFVAQQLELDVSPAHLCPIVLRPAMCRMDRAEAQQKVREAFAAVSAGVDVMLVNGSGPVLSRGSILGLSGVQTAEMLDAKVLLVGKCESMLDADSIVASHEALGDRLLGVVLNQVPPGERDRIWDEVVPCLEALRVTVLGLMPMDPVLHSVSVRELAEVTGGDLLCGEGALDELVENFVVGAMGVERALRYFRRTPRKCVITGGDRSDIQLAALETPTRCLILTGELRPRHTVLARAEELGVPVLLVSSDTLATVAAIENLLGKLRVREPRKVKHAVEQFEAHVELAKLDAALGLT